MIQDPFTTSAMKRNMTGINEFGTNEKGWDFGFDKSQYREKTHFVHRTSSFKAVSLISNFLPHNAVRAVKWGHIRVCTTGVWQHNYPQDPIMVNPNPALFMEIYGLFHCSNHQNGIAVKRHFKMQSCLHRIIVIQFLSWGSCLTITLVWALMATCQLGRW